MTIRFSRQVIWLRRQFGCRALQHGGSPSPANGTSLAALQPGVDIRAWQLALDDFDAITGSEPGILEWTKPQTGRRRPAPGLRRPRPRQQMSMALPFLSRRAAVASRRPS